MVTTIDTCCFDDEPSGVGCRTPESWRLLAKQGDDWVKFCTRRLTGQKPTSNTGVNSTR